MCRLLAYAGPGEDLAPYLTAGSASLRALACEHGHGWGLAAWGGPGAAAWVARSPEPADADPAFLQAASLRAPRVLAHIRRASAGRVALANTHPFAHGGWAFAHNGTIHGLETEKELAAVDADLLRLRAGETDSEVAFLLFLQELRRRHGRVDVGLDEAADALAGLARRLRAAYPGGEKPTRLNFLAGNGEGFVATRWRHDLHVRESEGAAVVASVPMGPAEGWREVPDGSVVVVRPGAAAVRPL